MTSDSALNLLVDARTSLSSGGAKLLREIVPRLAAQAVDGQRVGVIVGTDSTVDFDLGCVEIIRTSARADTWLERWKWYRSELPKAAHDWRADVLYSMSGFAPRALVRQIPTVATVNNMMPFSPEIQSELYAGDYSALLRYRILKSQYISGLKRADQVVLHSQHALDTLSKYVVGLGGKTQVVHTGIPTELAQAPMASHPYGGTPYLLFLSAFRRYKNHLCLLEAYASARAARGTLPGLKLAGFPADQDYVREIRDQISRTGLGAHVEIIEAVESADLPALMQHAELHILPTRCETNCVVAAEVMGVGGALVCSRIAPLTEVALQAALYFDPESVASIRDALVELWDSPSRRSELRLRALNRGRELSWDKCAAVIWDAARLAAQGRREEGRDS